MSDDKRGISLRAGPKRKGRPAISAPRQISNPIPNDGIEVPRSTGGRPIANGSSGGSGGPGLPGAPPPRARPPPATGGKTSDMVKRRYSTRFNNLPQDFDATAPPVPSMPTFDPSRYAQPKNTRPPPSRGEGSAGPSRGSGGPLTVDVKALRDPRLAPDQYVAQILSEATEDEIRDYEETLRKLKSRASIDLQQNVYQNRTQFIKISKEAEKLKTEMRSLRNLITELKSNTTALRAASVNHTSPMNAEFGTGLSKRDKRSSVADRTALWNSQIQALYKNVEGSQKFLPNSMGRHVVQDAGYWIELDNATYKSRRSMQIFLLNDHLLIASRKKRKMENANDTRAPATKLVADRCWPLLEIEVVDMAGANESSGGRTKLADAIMVRGIGQESFIYRTEKPEDTQKSGLMLNIRKAIEELRKGLQSEMEANNKAKETINYFASRDPGLLEKTELLQTLSDIKDMLIEVDGKQQNLRWVESQMDELDIDIALQRFEVAVAQVEKLKGLAHGLKNNTIAQDFINFKVEERSTKLAGLITRNLVDNHSEQQKTKRNVSWLAKLGFEDSAREAYLEARGNLVKKRSRQCIFQGDLHLYIWQLSFAYFSIIRNTVSCFQSCFPQSMMSACVKWAKEEVEAFNIILARQLSGTEKGGEAWNTCMERARTHAQMLAEVHLDFRDLVGKDVPESATKDGPMGLGLA
ncbi:Cullin repeat-like-containing domain protein [Xylariales sp. AK1849]|nr:Cullin repeat-like-containing domain protein [Xylariales sp. AK1849]